MSLRISRENAATTSVLSAMALVVLDAGLLNVALPTIGAAFAQTPARSLLVVGTYQLALLIGLLPCAQLADRTGPRRMFLAGIAVFGAAAGLCALAPAFPLLLAARALQGLGGAAVMALGIALLRTALGPERVASAIAWNALMVAICSALAPVIGALLLSSVGWRWLFLVPLPMAALALVAAPALPAVPAAGRRVDPLGIALYAAAAASLFAAAELARAAQWAALGVAAGAISFGIALFRREAGRAAPLIPFDLLALRPFRRSVAASALLFTGQSAGLLALSFYLQLPLGRSPAAAGLVLMIWPLAVAATSRAAGRLADRFAPAALCTVGAALLALGLAATALWPLEPTLGALAACAFACGVGFGLFQVPNNRSLLLTAPTDRSAAAGGLQGTARLSGQTAGALLVAFVLSAAPADVASRLAIGAAAMFALAAAFVSRARAAPAPCAMPGYAIHPAVAGECEVRHAMAIAAWDGDGACGDRADAAYCDCLKKMVLVEQWSGRGPAHRVARRLRRRG